MDVPVDYLKDSGAQYGDRGNGFTYGWDCDLESEGDVRDRGNAGTRESSMVIPDRDGSCASDLWNIALPNGDYTVVVGYSDPSYSTTTDGCTIEGQPAGVEPAGDRGPGTVPAGVPMEQTVSVSLTDGQITLDGEWGSPDGAHCQSFAYIHIYGAASGGVSWTMVALSEFTLAGSAQLASDGNVLSITQVANSQQVTAFVPIPVDETDDVNIKFSMYCGDSSGADGLCVNLGANTMGGRVGEDGVAQGVALCFDACANGADHGVQVFYNGGLLFNDLGECANRGDCVPVSLFEDAAWHSVVLTVGSDGAVNFDIDSGTKSQPVSL